MAGFATNVDIFAIGVQRVGQLQMIDDNMIEVMLCYILSQESEVIRNRTVAFPTAFYHYLKNNQPSSKQVKCFNAPQRSQNKNRAFNIFAKQMICIPVHGSYHFSMVLILNLGTLVSKETNSCGVPYIVLVYKKALILYSLFYFVDRWRSSLFLVAPHNM